MSVNGSTHHHSDAIIDRRVAAGLLVDADRGDHAAVEAALGELLDQLNPADIHIARGRIGAGDVMRLN